MPNITRRFFLQSGAMLAVALPAAADTVLDRMVQITPFAPAGDKKMRIGVVGGGFGLAFHWNEHPNCVVGAVSDLIPERRKRLQEKYQCDTAYESLEVLVKDETLDAVAIFTPAPDHARHVMLCFEHGKHVISACPACMTVEEAEQMRTMKSHTGLKYMSAETSYYRAETQLARQLYKAGAFGELVYSEAEYYHPGIGRANHELSMRDGQRTWRYGFPPMHYPTHSTAFLVGVSGERLVKVSCTGTGDPNEPALKDNAYNNPFLNGMALFTTDQGHPFRCNVAWDIHADGERAQWLGRDAALYMPSGGGQPFTYKAGPERVTELPDFSAALPENMRVDSGHGGSHPFLTHEFVMALAEDREPVIDLDMALSFCVPGIVAHESALQGGKLLDIPVYRANA